MREASSRPEMAGNERSLITLHGAAVLLVGLACGLAAVAEEVAAVQPQRWRAAHAALLMAGVWLLATAAVLPSLVLAQRERTALCWSLLATAYAFTTAILVQAVARVRVLGPDESLVGWVVFTANIVTVGAGLLAAALTVLGAAAALKRGG